MNLIKPKKIKPGDTISFIAPSGNIEQKYVLSAKKYFESVGYKVKLGKYIFNKDRYMAGTDEERIYDLHHAFSDTETDAIMCVRGGYGVLRLLSKIDYELIKNNPKIFCGYSDITALSAMILKNSGLITFSSPMARGDFQINDTDPYTESEFWGIINNSKAEITPTTVKIFKHGNCEGILFGGNLSTLASICGMDFVPDEKFILFAEDLNEPVYKIDRYFRQLFNTSNFKDNLAGIILGDFLDVEYPEQLDSLFYEFAKELNIPIYGGFKISHSKIKTTIPVGGYAKLVNGIICVEY